MTAREQRTLRWGGIAAGAILLYVLLVDPFLARTAESRELVEERESRLTRLDALERSLPVYRDRLAKAEAVWETQVAPRLLPGNVAAVAASALSREVRQIAAQSFLEVERENVLPADEEGGLTTVPVQFSMRGDVYGLRDFFASLQASRSFLNIREIRVNTLTAGFGPVPARGAPLQFTVTVEGFLGGTGSVEAGELGLEAVQEEPPPGAAATPEAEAPAPVQPAPAPGVMPQAPGADLRQQMEEDLDAGFEFEEGGDEEDIGDEEVPPPPPPPRPRLLPPGPETQRVTPQPGPQSGLRPPPLTPGLAPGALHPASIRARGAPGAPPDREEAP